MLNFVQKGVHLLVKFFVSEVLLVCFVLIHLKVQRVLIKLLLLYIVPNNIDLIRTVTCTSSFLLEFRSQLSFYLSKFLSFINKKKSINTNHNQINTKYSYTLRTLRACCSQSKFRILKIRESSAHALFLYNCTPNISRSADVSVG